MLRRQFAPFLDPPDGPTYVPRPLIRDRTPDRGPDEYVVSVGDATAFRRALRAAGYRPHGVATLKYVRDESGAVVWEQGSHAAGAWWPAGAESMHHCYWFPAREADLKIHVHHHREWPVVHPRKHQRGSRTHDDPEGRLADVVLDGDLAARRVETPRYGDGEN